jgi:hypothetical protein
VETEVATIDPELEVAVVVFPFTFLTSSPQSSDVVVVVCGYPGVGAFTEVRIVVVHFLQPPSFEQEVINDIKRAKTRIFFIIFRIKIKNKRR